jgi:hypothetical protein
MRITFTDLKRQIFPFCGSTDFIRYNNIQLVWYVKTNYVLYINRIKMAPIRGNHDCPADR